MIKYPITRNMQTALFPLAKIIADARTEARKSGDYKLADILRDCAGRLGFDIEDNRDGSCSTHPEIGTHWYLHFGCEGDDFPFTAKQIVDRISGITIETRKKDD